MIKSVYGKGDHEKADKTDKYRKVENYIKKAFSEGRILKFDKSKSQSFMKIPGLQLPNNLPSTDFSFNLSNYIAIVNKKNREVLTKFNNSHSKSKFSLKEPVEETDSLVAVHNLTEDKLLKTLKLEGIPMPSIAVTKSKMGWNNFGDISLVFGKDTIDPKNRKNKVYGADAWTPVVPSIQYDIDMTELRKLQNKVRSSLNGATENIRRAAEAFLNRLEYNMDSMGGIVGAVDDFANDTALMNYYLSLSGEAVEDVVKEKRTVMPEGQIEVAKRFIEEFGDKLPDIARMSGRDALAEYGDRIKKVLAEYS